MQQEYYSLFFNFSKGSEDGGEGVREARGKGVTEENEVRDYNKKGALGLLR